eukprot:5404308-Prymnesium_polylepis.2
MHQHHVTVPSASAQRRSLDCSLWRHVISHIQNVHTVCLWSQYALPMVVGCGAPRWGCLCRTPAASRFDSVRINQYWSTPALRSAARRTARSSLRGLRQPRGGATKSSPRRRRLFEVISRPSRVPPHAPFFAEIISTALIPIKSVSSHAS